ncbi:MAG: hypothetical protein WD009_03065 [Phycisphaeraceae bacterium]
MRRSSGRLLLPSLLALVAGAAGCGVRGPVNPSFDLGVAEARQAMDAMAATPTRLERPVVILAGWADPGIASSLLVRRLERVLDDDRIIDVHFVGASSFDEARERVIAAVDAAFTDGDASGTPEVDVVAVSMGGLVARHAAAPAGSGADGTRRLRVRRLFTIATPHQGARAARWVGWCGRVADMRPDATFLQSLPAAREAGYEIYAYVRLDDAVVGATRAGVDEATPAWWVANRWLQPAHTLAFADVRILADIARRLRGEPGWTRQPPTEVPPPFR